METRWDPGSCTSRQEQESETHANKLKRHDECTGVQACAQVQSTGQGATKSTWEGQGRSPESADIDHSEWVGGGEGRRNL